MNQYKIGVVTHYYDKIGVAVVELTSDLSVGDKIKFSRGGEDLFEQVVDSIQMEHSKVDHAKSGEVIGLKANGALREGAEVYKVA